jgi:hypothetical protein
MLSGLGHGQDWRDTCVSIETQRGPFIAAALTNSVHQRSTQVIPSRYVVLPVAPTLLKAEQVHALSEKLGF